MATAAFEGESNTVVNSRMALLPAPGAARQQARRDVIRQDVEELRDWMFSSGRRHGGVARTGLSARSVSLTLGRPSAAFKQAVDDGKLLRNRERGVWAPCRWTPHSSRPAGSAGTPAGREPATCV